MIDLFMTPGRWLSYGIGGCLASILWLCLTAALWLFISLFIGPVLGFVAVVFIVIYQLGKD